MMEFRTGKIPGTYLTLIGYSRAADETCFYIQELDIMLDCGMKNNFMPDHIFITHGHSDHSRNMPCSLLELGNSKNSSNTKHPIFYLPIEIVDLGKQYIHSFYALSKFNPNTKIHNKYDIVGVIPNKKIEIEIKNKKFIVEIIKCFHRVPCVGYGFTEVRQKLKDEYLTLKGNEIRDLKNEGIQITKDVEYPLFCFLGDTMENIFNVTSILNYPVIMIECSFLYDDEIQMAKEKSHISWFVLEPFVKAHPNKTFILFHFSKRYTVDEIKNFFDGKYNNIILWI